MKHYGFGHRLLAVFCTIILLVMMMPVGVFAAVDGEPEAVEENRLATPVALEGAGEDGKYSISTTIVVADGGKSSSLKFFVGENEVTEAAEGDTVTVVPYPAENYKTTSIFIDDADQTGLTESKSFVMPGENVKIIAQFDELQHVTVDFSLDGLEARTLAGDNLTTAETVYTEGYSEDSLWSVLIYPQDNYDLPDSVTFKVGDTEVSVDEWRPNYADAYGQTCGFLTIKRSKLTANATITAVGEEKPYVTIAAKEGSLSHLTVGGLGKVYIHSIPEAGYTLKLTADDHYDLSSAVISDGSSAVESVWDIATGVVTVPKNVLEAYTNKTVYIAANAQAHEYRISVNVDGALVDVKVNEEDQSGNAGTYMATINDEVVVTLTANPGRELPEQLKLEQNEKIHYETNEEKGTGRRTSATLTFDKGAVTKDFSISELTTPYAQISISTNHGTPNGKGGPYPTSNYQVEFTAESGYTLPANIGIECEFDIPNVTNDENPTEGYTWDSKNGTLTILAGSLQNAVTKGCLIEVSVVCELKNDNYDIENNGNVVGGIYNQAIKIGPKEPAVEIKVKTDDGTYRDCKAIIIGTVNPDYLNERGEQLEEFYYFNDIDAKEVSFMLVDEDGNCSKEKTLTLSVDTKSPVVTVSGYSIPRYSDTNSKHYTNDTIKVTFDVEEYYFKLGDDPLGSYEVQINGTKTTEGITWSEDGKQCTVTLNCKNDTQELVNELADGEYTVTLSVTDAAGNNKTATSETLVFDTKSPVVTVSGYSIESYSDTNSKHYTNNTITVTFDVSDTNFEPDKLGKYEVQINGTKTTEGIAWSEDGKHCTITLNCEDDTQVLANELADGEYTVTLSVTDAAENNKSATSETLVLDATAPTGEVTKYTTVNGKPKYAYSDEDNKRYVGDFVTITFKVTEKNFDPANFSFESLPAAGVTLGEWKTDPLSDIIHTIELTLKAGEAPDGVYDNIELNITDMAGNVVSEDKPIKSDPIVLDTTKPAIEKIEYSEKANSRLSQLLKNVWWWIVGKTNADNNEGELRKVKATVTVSDNLSPIDSSLVEPSEKIKNLQIVDRREASESKPEKGTYNGGYEATFTFEATAQFMEELAISATDAAGNESDALATTMDENGIVTASPNLLIDTYAPTIDFDTIDYGTVHNSDYSVGVHISDPRVDDVYSGLKEVRVSVHYQQSAITTSAATVPGYAGDTVDGEYVYTKTFASSAYVQGEDVTVTIPVALHSNLVYVEVTAVDNAGNSKTVTTKDSGWYIKMDNVLPVISVVYDNNSAQNNKYFKDTRTATITVEDNNFNAAGMTLNTRGSLGTWTATGQTNADGQNSVYTCAVSYVPDADYTLSITGTDMAGNTTSDAGVSYANQTAPQDFTVDRTVPTFTISMANADVDVASGGYSNQDVLVTLSVAEHNFDANAATAGLTVLYEGNDISQSIRSGLSWSNNGDVHTATFTIKDDGEYKINLSFLDLAGNSTAAAEDVVVRVDQTNAMVYVTGVADQSANAQKEIVPVVTVWDKYYNEDGVAITLINGEGKNVTDKYMDMENGRSEVRYDEQKDLYYQTFTFQNITEDHVYYLEVRHTDLAGNINSEMTVPDSEGKEKQLDLEKGRMRFSVNRNGSTYSANEETLAILGCYVQMAKNVRILEINVDELDPESIHITLTHDNVTRDLTYGEDYTYQVPPEQNDASWNVYEYVLSDSLFAEDGVYTISIYSVDAAGNVAQNNTEEKDFEITFVVDKTPPIFVALDLESGAIYNEEQHTATINCSDNIAFDTVHVYRLDSTAEKDESGNYIWFREKANGETEMLCEEIELTAVEGADGDYTFVLYEGDSAATSKQSVLVVCTDKAGNQNAEQEILDFTVSSSFWIRFYANKPLFYGSIGGVCALLIVAAVVFLRKKKDDERA